MCIGRPRGVSLVGEVLSIDLDEPVGCLLTREKAGIGEGFVAADPVVPGGVGEDGQLGGFGPDAEVLTVVGLPGIAQISILRLPRA